MSSAKCRPVFLALYVLITESSRAHPTTSTTVDMLFLDPLDKQLLPGVSSGVIGGACDTSLLIIIYGMRKVGKADLQLRKL